ncbi:hypothetical protein J7T55_014099 [Diaporthe amygdali]|uniref:uncharacterized protein n=1 Tax=Phomopsis amygdali TaxID=1214568 RepID=UPI0022FEDBED|nr:uncharacterized protein J7T55_014099 [Diaporthe amygdali]KAJ0109537.1 hypothetical protein J7T55_014099 [Diaporthe amygdali]
MSHRTDVLAMPTSLRQSRKLRRPRRRASVASFGSASSHDGGQTPVKTETYRRETWKGELEDASAESSERQNLCENPFSMLYLSRTDDQSSLYHSSKGESGPAGANDFASWWMEHQCVTDQAYYDEPATHTSSRASVTGCSQTLEAYPALLSYATFELFTHARKADEEDSNPSDIIQRLRSGIWRRWKALREDVDEWTEILYFAADLGLSSWLRANGGWERKEAVFAIEQAIGHENIKVFEKILDAFPSAAYAWDTNSRILLSLAHVPYAALLQVYLSRHPSQNRGSMDSIVAMKDILRSRDRFGMTALHLAVIDQNKAGVSALLKHGAAVSALDSLLRTPLHLACMTTRSADRSSGNKPTSDDDILVPRSDIIELLLDHHAQIDAVGLERRTPLTVACSNSTLLPQQDTGKDLKGTGSGRGDVNAVDVLLKHGANVIISTNGLLPLHRACWTSLGGRQSRVSIVRKLLDKGSPVNARGIGGGTPLHVACFCPDVQVVEELLRQGADPMLRDDKGCSPLQIAAAWSTEQVVETLLSHPDTSVHVIDNNWSTPLHVACNPNSFANQNQLTRLSITRRLLAHGAKAYTFRNRDGDSPADVARHFGFEEALELLARESCDAPPQESSECGEQRDC